MSLLNFDTKPSSEKSDDYTVLYNAKCTQNREYHMVLVGRYELKANVDNNVCNEKFLKIISFSNFSKT